MRLVHGTKYIEEVDEEKHKESLKDSINTNTIPGHILVNTG